MTRVNLIYMMLSLPGCVLGPKVREYICEPIIVANRGRSLLMFLWAGPNHRRDVQLATISRSGSHFALRLSESGPLGSIYPGSRHHHNKACKAPT